MPQKIPSINFVPQIMFTIENHEIKNQKEKVEEDIRDLLHNIKSESGMFVVYFPNEVKSVPIEDINGYNLKLHKEIRANYYQINYKLSIEFNDEIFIGCHFVVDLDDYKRALRVNIDISSLLKEYHSHITNLITSQVVGEIE